MTKQRCLTRLKRSILPVFCLVFTMLGYGPTELYLSNRGSEEFWFSFNEILMPFTVLIVVSLIVILGLLMVLPTKGYHAAMAVIVAVSALLLLQVLFLPNDYGSLNGAVIDWSQYTGRLVYNTTIWIVVIAGAIFWAFRNWQSFRKVMQFTAVILLVLQAATLVTAGITHTEENKETATEEVYLTTEGLYTVSSERNTIVFILDAFDSQLMCDLLEENNDELTSSFVDFTFYHNTSGGATRTKYAIPFILTGKTNDTGGTYVEYIKESFQKSPLFRELRTGKYNTGFYTEYGYVDRTQTEAIDNLSSGGKMKATSQWGLSKDILKMTAFKYMPHVLKPVFWMYSFELAQWRGGSGEESSAPYRLNDIQFYQTIKNNGLIIAGERPAFRFIHLSGAHGPFVMDENMQRISHEEGSEKKQGLGALRIVAEYVRQLKEMDLYNKADIFILADHGDEGYVQPNYEQNPLFMVKKAGEEKSFSVSEIKLSYHDLSSMLVSALHNDLNIETQYETQGTRYFYSGAEGNNSYRIIEFASEGNAYDADDWYLTGHDYVNLKSDIVYSLGTKLFFGENGGATVKKHFVEGFTYLESDYVWSDGKEAELQFEIGDINQNLLLDFDYSAVFNQYQRFYLYAGEQQIASFVARERGGCQYIIPKEAVKDGILDLRIYLPDAESPLEAGTGVDERVLGIAFRTITINLTDQQFEPEKQLTIRNYDLGQEIVFGKDGNMSDYAIGGISEDHWTSQKKVSIQLDQISTDNDLMLVLEYNIFGDQQNVIINANGKQIADYIAVGSEKKELVIPQTLLKNGKLTLEINLPNATKPNNGDQRELGLWMQRIVVRDTEEQKE